MRMDSQGETDSPPEVHNASMRQEPHMGEHIHHLQELSMHLAHKPVFHHMAAEVQDSRGHSLGNRPDPRLTEAFEQAYALVGLDVLMVL